MKHKRFTQSLSVLAALAALMCAVAPSQAADKKPNIVFIMVNRNGRTYYIFPDAAHNQAYVGGPQEYQAYQQLRVANNIAQENIETAQMYQDAAM